MEQQPKSELTVLRDYLGAVGAVRRARSIFLMVIVLSLLAHIGAYCLARWGDVMADRLRELRRQGALPGSIASGPTTSTMPATRPAGRTPAGAKATKTPLPTTRPGEKVIVDKTRMPVASRPSVAGIYREDLLEMVLPPARFAGLAASGLLIMTYLIGVNICLGGRMGGICHATSAFFWSIVLVTLLFPWRHLVPGAAIELPDAFFDMEQLRLGLQEPIDSNLSYVLHYGRFIGCPALAILAALASGVRFGLASRQVRRAVEPLVKMKVV